MFQMQPGIAKIASEPACYAADLISESLFGQIGPLPVVAQENIRQRLHRGQVANKQAGDPQPEIGAQSFGSVSTGLRKVARPREGCDCLPRTEPLRPPHCIAVAYL